MSRTTDVKAPSPIPRFDNPKMDHSKALILLGAGREKKIYAVPPYTDVRSLDFEDHPFRIEPHGHACALCGATESFLDEIETGAGAPLRTCSDTDWCAQRIERHDCHDGGAT